MSKKRPSKKPARSAPAPPPAAEPTGKPPDDDWPAPTWNPDEDIAREKARRAGLPTKEDVDRRMIRDALDAWEDKPDPAAPNEAGLLKQSVSLTDLSLTDLVKEPIPEDGSTDELAGLAAKWNTAYVLYGKRLSVIAWKLGQIYRLLRPRFPYGEWEAFIEKQQENGGPSLSTVSRCMRLAEHYEHEGQVKKLTLTRAYENAGILEPQSTHLDNIPNMIRMEIEQLVELTKRLKRILKKRRDYYSRITDDEYEYEGESILAIYEMDLQFNHALLRLRQVADPAELTPLHFNCPNLREWIKDKFFNVPKACIPDISESNLRKRAEEIQEAQERRAEWYEKHAPRDKRGFMNDIRFPKGPRKSPKSSPFMPQ